MSIIDCLCDPREWEEYQNYKIQKSHLTRAEEKELIEFVECEKYFDICNRLQQGVYTWGLPTKKLINKSGSTKKRTVYSFENTESMVLKFITHKLFRYDDKMSPNCFSFRKSFGVKRAISTIVSVKNINNMYCYKLDITNYFNSINIDKLLPILNNIIDDDPRLMKLLTDILTQDKSIFNGEVINEKRGAMAGTSLSTFLANIYLIDLDKYFYDNKIPYARYSDDIIVFADSKEKLLEYKNYIMSKLSSRDLIVNEDKEEIFAPHEPWSFLGIEYCDGVIDLSKVTIMKIKAKIRRKSRALYRWKVKKGATTEQVIKVMTKIYNRKFFETKNAVELTWAKWFFPLLTTDKGLKIIDNYLEQNLRYLSTGRYTKKNYNVRYEDLKSCNYRTLVNEFFKFKKEGIEQ